MNLYKSNFLEVSFDTQSSIMTNEWFSATADMKDENYQSEMLAFVGFVELNNPKFHLIRSVNFLYSITIEMQTWTNNHAFPRMSKAGIKKIAFLVSTQVIAQLSIEQVFEEENALPFEVKYFDNEADARKWLV